MVWRIFKLALKNKIYISEIILCSLQDGQGRAGQGRVGQGREW